MGDTFNTRSVLSVDTRIVFWANATAETMHIATISITFLFMFIVIIIFILLVSHQFSRLDLRYCAYKDTIISRDYIL